VVSKGRSREPGVEGLKLAAGQDELQELARALARAGDLRPALNRIAELALLGADARATYLETVDIEAGEVEIVATAGDAALAVGLRVPYPGSLAQQVLEDADIEIITSTQLARRPIGQAIGRGRCAGCSAVVAPLISEGQRLGALILLRTSSSQALLRLEAARFRVLADLAALALGRSFHAQRSARASLQLARSERSFRLFIESVEDYAIFLLDPDGRVMTWNRGAERIKGWRESEILGKSFATFYTKEDVAAGLPQALLERASREGKARDEGWRVRRNGVRVWADVTIVAVRDEAGVLWGFGNVTHDLSHRRQVEESLRASQEELTFLLDASSRLAASLDYRETLSSVTQLAVDRLADWCVADVLEDGEVRRLAVAHADPSMAELTQDYLRRYPPDPTFDRELGKSLRTGEAMLFSEVDPREVERAARSPEHLTLLEALKIRSAMIAPMVARGRTLGALTFVSTHPKRRYDERDLGRARELAARGAMAVDNARLYAEAHRRAQEEAALRSAAHAVAGAFSVEAVIRHIAERSLEAVNADGAFVERLDLTAATLEVVATAGSGTPPLGSRTPYPGSIVQQMLESSRTLLIESQSDLARLAAGLPDPCTGCSAILVPLIDAGEAIGALVLLRLPGGRRVKEDELERARAFGDLAALAFRKIHLLEDSEERREELQRTAESRERLIRGFSHDLRNPLGAADGYLSLIEEGVFAERDRLELSVARARRSIRSALELIEDLVELARAEAGVMEVETAPVDVRDVVNEMTEEYRAQGKLKGLQVGCSVPEELPIIQSDAQRLRQILGNLLSNAIKYTDEGSVRVTVDVAHDDAASWVRIAVADTGPGIPKEKQPFLFEEFRRLEPTIGAGVGLGLAISKRVAEVLGGRITLRSEADQGSEFTVWLPLR
jgi:PAS domain S-box-containing protein